jgi:excisionase family DNA binding protein
MEMNNQSDITKAHGMEKLLNVEEMAEILGISKNTLNHWISLRKIPFIKLGGRSTPVRFRPSQVLKWLESKEVKPSRIWR